MANMVIPDEGKLLWVVWAVQGDIPEMEDFRIGLYQNPYTPSDATLATDFVESTFPGYAAVLLDRNTFSNPQMIGGIAYITSNTPPTFNCTGGAGEVAHGWYMLGQSTGKTLAAAVFDTPHNMVAGAVEQLNPFRIGVKTLV